MLSKVLTREDCAACRNCCVFHEESRWEAPVADSKKAAEIRSELNSNDCVIEYQDSFSLATVKRQVSLKEGQEPYRCAALDEDKGCMLTEDAKPFDCSLWPIRVMRDGDGVSIMLASGCRRVDGTFIENTNTLIEKDLKERILQEVLKNPDIIKPYTDGYIRLCKLNGAF